MLFTSMIYMLILPLVLLINRFVPKKFRYIWLLAVSIAFYWIQNEGFAMMLVAAILITYGAALAVSAAESVTLKKIIAATGIIASVAILFVYKYLNFTLALCGNMFRFNFAIPLGISFYTFQAVSYMVDVYKDAGKVEKNPLKIALYLSFFLSVVSGPVNRAGDIIPQFTEPSDMSLESTKRGMQKMLWGYFLKLAIAGRLAIIVDNVYADAASYPGLAIAFTAIAYLFMLYCDFEGYSQIVIGSGYMLGIRMKENFRQPFMSSSMAEIWRRWHVSLSSWLRDYVYIPLGGNRKGIARKYVNIFITLFVSGIWHGANFTFFIWGALNGAYIIIGQLTIPYRDRLALFLEGKLCKKDASRKSFARVRLFFQRIGVYLFTAFTFIFFANKDVASAWFAVKGILMRFSAKAGLAALPTLGLGTFGLLFTALMAVLVLVADSASYKKDTDTPALIMNIPTVLRWAIYWAILIAILFSANLSGKEFIYSKM